MRPRYHVPSFLYRSKPRSVIASPKRRWFTANSPELAPLGIGGIEAAGSDLKGPALNAQLADERTNDVHFVTIFGGRFGDGLGLAQTMPLPVKAAADSPSQDAGRSASSFALRFLSCSCVGNGDDERHQPDTAPNSAVGATNNGFVVRGDP